jgi:hypothetical protein
MYPLLQQLTPEGFQMKLDMISRRGTARKSAFSGTQLKATETKLSASPTGDTYVAGPSNEQSKPNSSFFSKAVKGLKWAAPAAAVTAVVAAVSVFTPAGPAVVAGFQAGGIKALTGAGIGLVGAGVPTKGVMGLPGAVVGGLVGVGMAAGAGVALGMTAGAAALVGAAYAGGIGAAMLVDRLSQSAGADKKSPLYGLNKTLPKNSQVRVRRLASANGCERPRLSVDMPKFQADGWLRAQGAKKDTTGEYHIEGYDVSTGKAAAPDWSHVDWLNVTVSTPPH